MQAGSKVGFCGFYKGVAGSDDMSEYRVPADGMYTVQSDPWMMLVDWDQQLPELHAFIWG